MSTAAQMTEKQIMSDAGTQVTPGIELTQLVRQFIPDGPRAVDRLSLTIEPGTFVSLLGASGCGKTTTLRMIAGLETPDSGEISIAGTTVFSSQKRINVAPHRRPISMVFQSYALWPHMTVFDNIAYPLRRARMPKAQIADAVASTLAILKCEPLAKRYPSELSGGQQQRIALGRAIINPNSEVILFDEPLSNLDAKLRDELRYDLRALQEDLKFTALYVTHDQSEAMSMSDHVVVMRDGRIERSGSPADVFNKPGTEFVAAFFGAQNIVSGRVDSIGSDGALVVDTALGKVDAAVAADAPVQVGTVISLAVPASAIRVQPSSAPGTRATVSGASFYGDYSDLRLDIGDETRLRVRHAGSERFERGDEVTITVVGTLSGVTASAEQGGSS